MVIKECFNTMEQNKGPVMHFKLTVFFVVVLMVAVVPNRLHSADGFHSINSTISVRPFAPFDDDPAIYNDCNYCHGLHNARKDISALLNEKEERYSRYLGNTTPSGFGGESVFEWKTSRKCPRSRSKNNR